MFDEAAWLRLAEREVDDRMEHVVEIQRDAARAALQHVVIDSPIWTGWYQSNHHVTLDEGDAPLGIAPSDEAQTLGTGELALSLGEIMARAEPILAQVRFGDSVYVVNTRPGADSIEYEGTKTKPAGMIYHGGRRAAELTVTIRAR